jgi:hypothetical protein
MLTAFEKECGEDSARHEPQPVWCFEDIQRIFRRPLTTFIAV